MLVVLLAGSFTAGAVPRMPVKNFDCQVLAKTGIHALVMVQADTAEEAMVVAQGTMSFDMQDRRSPTLSVIECVEFPGETFKDTNFQAYVELLAR
ncbi:hypothetical protein [Parahaliea mediterranea]|uniref:Uncharacterized protein n=1 Tax=Parahaliea mediterranea TaxID=651086 RepID=A0A939DCG5_9GAMM|nr:hypothetical protein [Parahaliea mediterranea]MBN7795683.1 hypothetical protein [Parahaliea mediterranea]